MTRAPVFDILGAGTLAVDDFLYVNNYPERDHKARIQRRARHLGGQVATGLAAAAALGATCACVGMLGEDELSSAMRDGLAAAGIDLRFIHDARATPIHSFIVVEEASKTRTIFYDPASTEPFPACKVSEQLATSARVVFIDQLGPETGIALAARARQFGIPVVLDMEWPDVPGVCELLASATDVLVSLSFGAAITGSNDPVRIAATLHDGVRDCTAVTCGKDGCFAIFRHDAAVTHVPPFTVDTVETTGCGDVFHGAYATNLSRGVGGVAALRYASAAAAIYASRPAGWQYLPRAQEVEQMLSTSQEGRA